MAFEQSSRWVPTSTLIVVLNILYYWFTYHRYQADFDQFEKFDFIVVGASPSGAVIANRLSEIPQWKVLLLEVGDEPSFLAEYPFTAGYLSFTNSSVQYFTEKNQRTCLSCPEQKMFWPRGKVLGGSSITNFMIATRGNKLDFDRWAAMGNPGWSYKDVFPYFLKSEDAHIEKADPGFHGKDGYLSISTSTYRTEASEAFVRAAQEAGYPYVDCNGKEQFGVSYLQSTTRNAKRGSAEKAFLRPIRHRSNLKILKNSKVEEILINPKTKSAYGVKFSRDSELHKAFAGKEVILSAGSINSPHILMLSGVGPKQHLQELGIPVIEDLPVGQKLYDHLVFSGAVYQLNESIAFDSSRIFTSLIDYFFWNTGPLTTPNGIEAIAFIKTNASKDSELYPDIELLFVSLSLNADDGQFLRKIVGVSDEPYNMNWRNLRKGYVVQVIPMVTHPKSFGYMKLQSKSPYQPPKFYPQYLSDPEDHDLKTFIAGLRETQRIMSTHAMKRYDAKMVPISLPACEGLIFDSDDYWICTIQQLTSNIHHQMSTCKMGPSDDPEAVVDSNLRVYGIKNLRVADASVVPLPLTAHTVLPAYMIGEKASDLLKETWGSIDENRRNNDRVFPK